MTIVDSSVWIDYFNGKISRETELLDRLMGQEPLGVFDLILTEVLQGFAAESDFALAKNALNSLTFYSTGKKSSAIRCAENCRTLRKKGITIRKTIDAIIATNCIEYDFPLLHCDRDFDPFVAHLGLKAL
ncbi:PIN domain nuclease [Haliscomenobacter hydrossis]|uniref:PilT protein domain protein n=1 Tax=Haliscomenobacter hydrossis (strain ATCC 27775 / DSM 1100 / LMG 10767 / O) TaxID=760192 RepID=F4L598_HALH1|nr:PIN domain nuclease [Haliscomenobacter hydrossis]AEE49778.1 PilT protein domain protein [Haliscomenobacter hydrossis DSM 1100]